jgi:hypothetical protein
MKIIKNNANLNDMIDEEKENQNFQLKQNVKIVVVKLN